MKNFLKSTVSAFVLLSALATFTPSKAMEEENGEGKEERSPTPSSYAQRKIPDDLSKILTPFEDSHLQPPGNFAVIQENDDPKKPFTLIPNELTQLILSFTDAPALLTAQSVCTLWRSFSLEEDQRRLKHLEQWQPGDESEELVKAFILNPHNLVWTHQILARIKLLYPTMSEPYPVGDIPIPTIGDREESLLKLYQEDPTLSPILNPTTLAEKIAFRVCSQSFIPEVIQKYALILNGSPSLHPFVSRLFLNSINVLDVPATSLAAYFIKLVPGLRDIFQSIVKAIPFEPSNFADVVKNPENRPQLQQYLMALRLLALSGNTEAKDRLNGFSQPVREFFHPNVIDTLIPEELASHLFGQPFWGAYTQDSASLYAQWEAISRLSYGNNLDPNLLKSFWEYCSVVDPRTSNVFKGRYLGMLEKFNRTEDKEHIANMIHSLSTVELQKLLSPPDYNSQVCSEVDSYILSNRSSLALLIIEEAKKRLETDSSEDVPFRLKLGMTMATYNIHAHDERFPEAAEYLQRGLCQESDVPSKDANAAKQIKSKSLLCLFIIYSTKNDKKSICDTLSFNTSDDELKMLVSPPDDAPNHNSPVEHLFYTGHRFPALAILEEAKKRLGDDLPLKKRSLRAFSYIQSLLRTLTEKGDEESFSRVLEKSNTNELRNLFDRVVAESHSWTGLPFDPYDYALVNERDNPHISTVGELIYSERHQALTRSLLVEAHKRLKEDPIRLSIELYLAEHILVSKSKEQFSQTEEYINNVLEHFQKREWSESEDEFLSLDDSDSRPWGESSDDDLDIKYLWRQNFFPFEAYHRNEALEMRIALRIYQNRLQDAADDLIALKGSDLLEFSRITLMAIQTHLPDLPNNFLSLIGEKRFPLFFGLVTEWKTRLENGDFDEENGDLLYDEEDILEDTKEYKWFFDAAIERGLLEKGKFKEVIDFCHSLIEETSPPALETPGNTRHQIDIGEGEGKETGEATPSSPEAPGAEKHKKGASEGKGKGKEKEKETEEDF